MDWSFVFGLGSLAAIVVVGALIVAFSRGAVGYLLLFVALLIWGVCYRQTIADGYFWSIDNWANLLVYVGEYLFLGFVFAIVRWWFYVRSNEVKANIARSHALFEKSGQSNTTTFAKSSYYPFGWRQDSQRISQWVAFWPIVGIWWVLADVLRHVATGFGRGIKAAWNWAGGIVAGLFAAIAQGSVNSVIKK